MEEMMLADNGLLVPDDEDADDCICGIEHLEDEATSDEELPPAWGGIEITREEPQDSEDHIDGCDVDFAAVAETGDEELPAAVGGM
jgi:hypothetical protein